MTDPEPSTADAVSDQLDEHRSTAADGPPTSSDGRIPRARRSIASSARSRTTSCGWAASSRTQIRAAIEALVEPRRRGRPRGHRGRRPDQRGAARTSSRSITTTIATQQPVARDLRFLLSLDHVTYELERMGDHAASVAKQARKLAPEPPLQELRATCREMGELGAELVHGVLRALVDVDQDEAREVAAGDDEIDDLYHATFDEVLDLMRADPRQRRARHADPVRGALPRADRRPGHEHRRGRRLPRDAARSRT